MSLIGGAIALNVLGGLVANQQASGDADRAIDAATLGLREFQNIEVPDIEKMKLLLEKYGYAGDLTPEAMQALALSQQDQLQDVSLDPRLRKAQMDALQFMQQTGQAGLTPAERAQLNDLRRQTEADNTARLQALLQQQDMRGVGSSDMALAQRMLEAQSSANRQAASTDQLAGLAFQRALQSMTQGANLAGSMEQADYARQAQLADALRGREMQQWLNQQNIANQNVTARNAAQQFNRQNQQNVMNKNVDLSNQQQQYNTSLYQRDFDNRITRAQGIAGSAGQAAKAYGDKAQATRDMWGNIVKGGTKILAGK